MTDRQPHRDDPVAEALARCTQITRQHARNFYYGLKMLPQPKRDGMYVVYAWMRRADDCADGQIEGNPKPTVERRRVALDQFQKQTDRVFRGEPAGDLNLMTALRWAVETFHLSPAPFDDMLNGQRSDLERSTISSFDELLMYCRQVGSSVGRISIDIWGYQHDDAPELADRRGIAFQLTNIIRDFAEDYDTGRVYLPADEFEEFDLTAEDLRKWRRPAACEAMLAAQISRARGYYEQSDRLDQIISADCRATSTALKQIYRRLLDKLERNVQGVATGQRIALNSMSKLMIALRARRTARQAAVAASAGSERE